ncbi:metalloproteinase inhibitor 1-like [Paroedura picta]|uniref:metalloproteinase inhibitor 1-like n=1 Tax=Paroedura picta TaxID=143630 RepID=UPI00405719C6
MKMESAKLCKWLAASFLLLALLTDLTAACNCNTTTAEDAYCSSPSLVKAQVLGYADPNDKTLYNIKVTLVLKGPETLKSATQLGTEKKASPCVYTHPTPFNKDEYVFSVTQDGKKLTTSPCGFNRRWAGITRHDQRGFRTAFRRKCRVIRAQFLDATENEEKLERIYEIRVTQVVKGPSGLKKYKRLYTASQSNLCGYKHPVPFTTDEYLIAGTYCPQL